MSSDEEDIIVICWFVNDKKIISHWLYPYIETNFTRTAFIAAKELSEDDRIFQSFYWISKDIFAEVVRVVGPAITKRIPTVDSA
jgi:hypothetical protein